MKPLAKGNQNEFDSFLSTIQEDFDKWYIISFSIKDNYDLPYDELIAKVSDEYTGMQGIIYHQGCLRVICIAKLGNLDLAARAKANIAKVLPSDGLFISIQKLTQDSLSDLQTNYMRPDEDPDCLYDQRFLRDGGKALVVDDDPMMRMTMRKVLSQRCEVVDVSESDEVVDAYKANNPDVVFLDIHMPGKSGLQILQDIFKIDLNAYIVMVSADRGQDQVIDAIQKGCAGYIAKPIQKEKVYAYLKKCVTISNDD